MNTRRIFAQPDEIIELVAPNAQSVLKIQVLQGSRGHNQVFVYTQPGAATRLNPPQYGITRILEADLLPHELPKIDIV
jgi:hypothetical protein